MDELEFMEGFELMQYLKDKYDQLNYIAIEDKNDVLLKEVQLCKNRDINIMKKLKRKMNILVDKGYEVMFVALYGSQNYRFRLHKRI